MTETSHETRGFPPIQPIDAPRLEGRKAFVTATMTYADGTVLSVANGLMIKLLPHQPCEVR